MGQPKIVALYLRVSTDDQTVENQRQALAEACERRGWRVGAEYIDAGISGANGRSERAPEAERHSAGQRSAASERTLYGLPWRMGLAFERRLDCWGPAMRLSPGSQPRCGRADREQISRFGCR